MSNDDDAVKSHSRDTNRSTNFKWHDETSKWCIADLKIDEEIVGEKRFEFGPKIAVEMSR
jgi:hypothetical protein